MENKMVSHSFEQVCCIKFLQDCITEKVIIAQEDMNIFYRRI